MEKLKITPGQIPESQSSQIGCQNIDEELTCETHGLYKRWHILFSGKPYEQTCPFCRDEKIERDELKRESDDLKSRISDLHRESNIPKRFKGLDINKIDLHYHKTEEDNLKLQKTVEIVKGYLNTYEERLKNGASGFFSGECGTGKTMLACMMVESIINQCHSAHYVTAWNMIQEIRQGYKKDLVEDIRFYIKKYINKSFLVIDEIGVQHGTEDERILLYQVIDGRYNEVKPTVLISNSKNPVEDGYLDLRTIDRLNEGGGFSITFTGESFRK